MRVDENVIHTTRELASVSVRWNSNGAHFGHEFVSALPVSVLPGAFAFASAMGVAAPVLVAQDRKGYGALRQPLQQQREWFARTQESHEFY